MSDASRFAGQTAIVTGAASGLGAAIAAGLAAEGARVVVVDLSPDRVAAAVSALGPLAVGVAGDVSDEATAAKAMETAGAVDILVNNAGIDPFDATDILSTPPAQWDRIMAVNLRGPYLFSRAVIPGMASRGGGALVHVGSTYSTKAARGELAYAVSKYALVQFSRCLALDHAAQGIRSNCVCPGLMEAVMTDRAAAMTDAQIAARSELARKLVPLGREAAYRDVAQAALFLADRQSAGHITGAALAVDGGDSL